MAGVSTEMETVRQNQKEMLEIKNAVTKDEKKIFDGLIIDWSQLMKEPLSLRVSQQKLQNLKKKKKDTERDERNRTDIQEQ